MKRTITSKIKSIFDDETLRLLAAVCDSRRIPSNRTKIITVCQILKEKGISAQLLGGATNRVAFQISGYAVKIAVDHQGFKDNLVEYAICPELQPYVTKAYETSGYVLVSECVRLLTKEEWKVRKAEIIKVLDILSSDYLLGDVGYVEKNRTNWGVRDDGSVVILDYAYCHRATEDLFVCNVCGDGILVYDETYDILMCNNRGSCRAKFTYNERKRIQGDQVDLDMVEEQKKLSIVIRPNEKEHLVETMDDYLIDGNIRVIHNWYEMALYKQEMEEKLMSVNLEYDNEVTLDDLINLSILQKEDPEKAKELMREIEQVSRSDGYADYCLSENYDDGYNSPIAARAASRSTNSDSYEPEDPWLNHSDEDCLTTDDLIDLVLKTKGKSPVIVAGDDDIEEYVDGVVLHRNQNEVPKATSRRLIVNGVEIDETGNN